MLEHQSWGSVELHHAIVQTATHHMMLDIVQVRNAKLAKRAAEVGLSEDEAAARDSTYRIIKMGFDKSLELYQKLYNACGAVGRCYRSSPMIRLDIEVAAAMEKHLNER